MPLRASIESDVAGEVEGGHGEGDVYRGVGGDVVQGSGGVDGAEELLLLCLALVACPCSGTKVGLRLV